MSVAIATGQRPLDVLQQDYAQTFWTWCELKESERLDELQWDYRSLIETNRQTMGYHKPEELKKEWFDFKRKAGLVMTRETALEHAQKLQEQMSKAIHVSTEDQ